MRSNLFGKPWRNRYIRPHEDHIDGRMGRISYPERVVYTFILTKPGLTSHSLKEFNSAFPNLI